MSADSSRASGQDGAQAEVGGSDAAPITSQNRSERAGLFAPHAADSGLSDRGLSAGRRSAEAAPTDRDLVAEGAVALSRGDTFEFLRLSERSGREDSIEEGAQGVADFSEAVMVSIGGDGRPGPGPDPAPVTSEDQDPDTPLPPVEEPPVPQAPVEQGRLDGETPGTPQDTPPSPAPGTDNAETGRPDGAVPDTPPAGPVTSYTSGGAAATSYNVTIEFVGTWTGQLQSAFTEAADYLGTIILADLPDAIVDGVAVDDVSITATLQGIDGIGGVLGSAGPRAVRTDGPFLPATGAMTFDSADAQNQFDLGNWETIVLHEMMHAVGFGTMWSSMGLTSGTVAGGNMRFTGANATDTYQSEFATIAAADSGSLLGVPVETDGGPGTAGGHWDEALFNAEIMTGFVDAGSFVSTMTIAALEDMGYDTVFDNPNSATDLFGPLPVDPLLDLLV